MIDWLKKKLPKKRKSELTINASLVESMLGKPVDWEKTDWKPDEMIWPQITKENTDSKIKEPEANKNGSVAAIYKVHHRIEFLRFESFSNDKEREIFIRALRLNAISAAFSDTDPYLEAYRIPEQLDEVDFDDEILDRMEEIGLNKELKGYLDFLNT